MRNVAVHLTQRGVTLLPVAFEHVEPERFDFFNVTAFAVHRYARKQEAFSELTI